MQRRQAGRTGANGWICGAMLARPHATGDAAAITGYWRNSVILPDALAKWAAAYGDQTAEHGAPVEAIKSGRLIPLKGI